MTVYVDPMHRYPDGLWCRMAADTPEELHAMARHLRLKINQSNRRADGVLYYLLARRLRDKAIGLGAVRVSAEEWARLAKYAANKP